jgi:hypothetical protein
MEWFLIDDSRLEVPFVRPITPLHQSCFVKTLVQNFTVMLCDFDEHSYDKTDSGNQFYGPCSSPSVIDYSRRFVVEKFSGGRGFEMLHRARTSAADRADAGWGA